MAIIPETPREIRHDRFRKHRMQLIRREEEAQAAYENAEGSEKEELKAVYEDAQRRVTQASTIIRNLYCVRSTDARNTIDAPQTREKRIDSPTTYDNDPASRKVEALDSALKGIYPEGGLLLGLRERLQRRMVNAEEYDSIIQGTHPDFARAKFDATTIAGTLRLDDLTVAKCFARYDRIAQQPDADIEAYGRSVEVTP